ncbi:V-set and immunoglobulin domain-containing protein 10-like 2 [Menidia menidia]
MLNPEEVEYVRFNSSAVVGGSVALNCGSQLPSIFLWGFTRAGSDSNVALAHNYGQGPRIQNQAGGLGRVRLAENSSVLELEEIQREAQGTYTCQALYHSQAGARVTFFYTRLDLEDN